VVVVGRRGVIQVPRPLCFPALVALLDKPELFYCKVVPSKAAAVVLDPVGKTSVCNQRSATDTALVADLESEIFSNRG